HTSEPAARKSGKAWFEDGRDDYQNEHYAMSAAAYMQAAMAGYRTGTAYYNAACSLALDGWREPALDALEQALDAGFDDPGLMARDDDLDILRSEPRFKALLARARHTDSGVAD